MSTPDSLTAIRDAAQALKVLQGASPFSKADFERARTLLAQCDAQIETAKWFDDMEAELEARNPDGFAKEYAKDNKLNYHDL
jgi:hypothetical protein